MILNNQRNFVLLFIVLCVTTACSNGIGSNNTAQIDARVDATLNAMYEIYPSTEQLASKASGILIMPLITEGGFGIGAGFGRGALRVGGSNVDYYSAASASAGFQIGAQQYSHVLLFMTENALLDFRASQGWAAGVNVEYVLRDQGNSLNADTTTTLSPVVAIVFAQVGLRLGATLDGIKYTRIIP